MKTGVYIHIPFCRGKCDYCAFYSVPARGSDPLFQKYTDKLITEIRGRLGRGTPVDIDTVYFGGGTPSLLQPSMIKNILEAVFTSASADISTEVTLEINPEDINPEKTDELIAAGINRFVAGIQSFDETFLEEIGRRSSLYNRPALGDLFSRKNIVRSLDLISGRSRETAVLDALRAVEFKPDHISLYMLTIEDGTPLKKRIKCDDTFEPGLKKAFEAAADILTKKGFTRYEISNFCAEGKVSRHNMKYWRFDPYIGFGPSAHSFYEGERYWNNINLESYLAAEKIIPERDIRSENQIIAEYIMTSIRLLEGFTLSSLSDKLKTRPPDSLLKKIPILKKQGYLEHRNDDTIRLAPEGIMWSDYVIYELVEGFIAVL